MTNIQVLTCLERETNILKKKYTEIYNLSNIHQIFPEGLLYARSFSRPSGKQNRCNPVLAPRSYKKKITHFLYDFLKSYNAICTLITYN